MSLDTVRISKQGRDQLITLKRRTGIENWNILCRWAFCVSVADPSPPRNIEAALEGGVEMTWRTFGGDYEGVYLALLKERCQRDGLDLGMESLASQFRLHVHRGIASLVGSSELKDISSLVRIVDQG